MRNLSAIVSILSAVSPRNAAALATLGDMAPSSNLGAIAFLAAVSHMNVGWRGEQQEGTHTSPQGGLTREQVENLLAETTGYHRGLPFGTQIDNARLLAQSVLRPLPAAVERTYTVRPAATGPDRETVALNDLRARAKLAREAAIAFSKAINAEQLRKAIEEESAHWAEGDVVEVTTSDFEVVKARIIKREVDRFDLLCKSLGFAEGEGAAHLSATVEQTIAAAIAAEAKRQAKAAQQAA